MEATIFIYIHKALCLSGCAFVPQTSKTAEGAEVAGNYVRVCLSAYQEKPTASARIRGLVGPRNMEVVMNQNTCTRTDIFFFCKIQKSTKINVCTKMHQKLKLCSWQIILNTLDQLFWSIQFFWYPYWHTLWHYVSYGICHRMSYNDKRWPFMTFDFYLI